METKQEILYKGDQKRFVDYAFGNVQTQNLEINGNVVLNNILVGNPVDGGTINIPTTSCVVILQNTAEYTQLTLKMPLEPSYGQTLTIVSTVNVLNLSLDGTFGTTKPIEIRKDIPLRFIYAGLWFNI